MKKFFLKLLAPTIIAVLAFVLIAFEPFSTVDNYICDKLYSRLRSTNKDIIIIKIDEKTLDAYGSFTSWSRDKVADVLNLLYENEKDKPLLVGIDINFQGKLNEEADAKLVEACKDRDIIVAAPVVFNGKIQLNADNVSYNMFNIGMIEYPFAELEENVNYGFSNVFLGNDSVSRFQMNTVDYKGIKYNSFCYEVASFYAQQKGFKLPNIKTNKSGLYRFFYAGKNGEYPSVSMVNVLEGKIPTSEFRDKVVLIGAYATGMQDHYLSTKDIGGNMYGVEMQANVIQAILEEQTATSVNKTFYGLAISLIVFLMTLLCENAHFLVNIFGPIISIIIHLVIGKYVASNGVLIPQIYMIAIMLIMLGYLILNRYLGEAAKRRNAMKLFGRYMDPVLVKHLDLNDELITELGGHRREIAVLFVDIRGFTTMSESLQPEEVVGILNDYLSMVAECIFKHHGMLDKFIGDAAMALFNAPTDQEDYAYEAIATAYDIVQRSEELSKGLLAKFGKTISYGIGVNIGPAVVGNIGSNFRMDYTAIGDTVNTAARLEANAKPGEVLISQNLKDRLDDRIVAEDAGMMKFKGKSKEMNVYRLKGLKEYE